MDSTRTGPPGSAASARLTKIVDDITELRRDISALAGQLKASAVNGAGEAVDDLGDKAKKLYGNLAEQGERQARTLREQVKEQPIACLLLAFAIGLVSSRLLPR